MVKPMTPEEGLNVKPPIPDFVIESVNEILREKLRNGSCTFKQEELMERVLMKTDMTPQEIYDQHYFDFEPLYRDLGWKVSYDKPGFNETYTATFTFIAERKGC